MERKGGGSPEFWEHWLLLVLPLDLRPFFGNGTGAGSSREHGAPGKQESDPTQTCLQVTPELVYASPRARPGAQPAWLGLV